MPRKAAFAGRPSTRRPVGRTECEAFGRRRRGAKSLADDLVTDRGVVSGRAATIPRFAETRPSIGRFVGEPARRVRMQRAQGADRPRARWESASASPSFWRPGFARWQREKAGG
jgi:hypothetical protein